jgi:hypothetical protein
MLTPRANTHERTGGGSGRARGEDKPIRKTQPEVYSYFKRAPTSSKKGHMTIMPCRQTERRRQRESERGEGKHTDPSDERGGVEEQLQSVAI